MFFPFDAEARSAAVDRKGRVVVAGGNCLVGYGCIQTTAGREATFVRLLPSGRLDRSFGRGGKAQYSFGNGGSIQELTLRGDGTIVGLLQDLCPSGCFNRDRFVALKSDGSLDRRFGNGGRLTIELGARFGIVELFPAGKGTVDAAGVLQSCRAESRFAVLRINRQGKLDRSFGGGDGVIDSGVKNGLGVYAEAATKQSKDTVTMGGAAYYRGKYGATASGTGMVRFDLDARDGRTVMKPCAS